LVLNLKEKKTQMNIQPSSVVDHSEGLVSALDAGQSVKMEQLVVETHDEEMFALLDQTPTDQITPGGPSRPPTPGGPDLLATISQSMKRRATSPPHPYSEVGPHAGPYTDGAPPPGSYEGPVILSGEDMGVVAEVVISEEGNKMRVRDTSGLLGHVTNDSSTANSTPTHTKSEMYSDSSQSLPGITGIGAHPTGFHPSMFKSEEGGGAGGLPVTGGVLTAASYSGVDAAGGSMASSASSSTTHSRHHKSKKSKKEKKHKHRHKHERHDKKHKHKHSKGDHSQSSGSSTHSPAMLTSPKD
jgi:hypothetical protein